MSAAKRIRDPLYAFVEVEPEDLQLLDHPLVQRLRWVNQLPLEQLVYPSAQHSRFEHSLGVFHLCRLAAEALVRNTRKEFLLAVRNSEGFQGLTPEQKRREFVRCAGWCGLLHDIGHAPFSHTFEDACSFSDSSPVQYDHEAFGSHLANRVLTDASGVDRMQADIVGRVLDKNHTLEDLYPAETLLRLLIDGPIDVDKGDYLRRDSYHCGVTYGDYDASFLWNNLVIIDGGIGVREKAALEAWGLRLARQKMHAYVYKHHVRNITDAMLVDVLVSAFESAPVAGEGSRRLVPLQKYEEIGVSDNRQAFVHWTDDNLLKSLNELDDASIKRQIEAFSSRRLYKERFRINLDDYPNALVELHRVFTNVRSLRDRSSPLGADWTAVPVRAVLVPVWETAVQREIVVRCENGDQRVLADVLGFPVDEDSVQFQGATELCIHAAQESRVDDGALRAAILDVLGSFRESA